MSIPYTGVQNYGFMETAEETADLLSDVYDWVHEQYEEYREERFSHASFETEELYESIGIDKLSDRIESFKDMVKTTADRFVPWDAGEYVLPDNSDYRIDSLDLETLEAFEEASRDREDLHTANLVLASMGTTVFLGLGMPIPAILNGALAMIDGAGATIERYNRLRSNKVKNWLDGREGG